MLGPIPWSAIEQYADLHCRDDEHKERFHVIMRDMDDAYLDYIKPKPTVKHGRK